MPEPNKNETEEDYVSRCIPIVLKEGTAKDNSQASAICHSMYKEKRGKHSYKGISSYLPRPVKGETVDQFMVRCKPLVSSIGYRPEMAEYCCLVSWDCWVNDEQPPELPPGDQGGDGDIRKPEQDKPEYPDDKPKVPDWGQTVSHQQSDKKIRQLYTFDMDCDHAIELIQELFVLDEKTKDPNKYTAVALKGDRFYKGKFLSFKEMEKARQTMDGAYHDINHYGTSDPRTGDPNIEYIIGYQQNTRIDPGKKQMTTDIIVNPDAPHYKAWKNFMDINQKIGRTPNVSVSFWADNKMMKARDLPTGINYSQEGFKEDSDVPTLSNISFQALSTVFKGACDDTQGCGIQNKYENNEEEQTRLELVNTQLRLLKEEKTI